VRAFWTVFWGVAASAGLFWLTGECDIHGWGRLAILFGGVTGVTHTVYNYEEIACTCDDPDHEH
jgi:hypothetical protein